MKKWAISIAAGMVILFLIIELLLTLYKDSIRTQIEKEVDKKVEAVVTFDKVKLSLWHHFPSITLILKNVAVAGKNEFEKDTLVSVETVAVQLDMVSFLHGKIKLKRIHLNKPDIKIIVLENGKTNYDIVKPDSASQDGDSTSTAIDIDQVVIDHGNLSYDDRAQKIAFNITDIQHTGSGNLSQDVFDYSTNTSFYEMTLDYNQIRYLDKKKMDLELVMKVDPRKQEFTFVKNSISINHFKLGLNGSFALLENGYNLDLKFATQETSFKNILSLMPGIFLKDMEHISTEGEASLTGFVKGRYIDGSDSIPVFLADLKVKDGLFKIDNLPASLNKIQCDLVVENSSGITEQTIFDLRTVHLEVGDQPIHGRIKVQGLTNYKIDADLIAGLNLHEIETIYPIVGFDMKGRVDLELKMKGDLVPPGKKDTTYIPSEIPQFSINMKVKEGSFKYDSLPAGIKDIRFHLAASNTTGNIENTSTYINDLSLKLHDNLVTGYLKVIGFTNYNINTDIQASLDLADLEKIFPIERLTMSGHLNADIKASGDYNKSKKVFPAVDANIDLINGFIKSEEYPEPIKNIHLLAEVINTTGKMENSQLNIKQFTYTLEDEPFIVSGSINDFEKYAYDFKIKGTVDLDKLTKIYPVPGMSLSGIIDSDIETTGRLADLEKGHYRRTTTSGTIEVKNLSLSGEKVPNPISVSDALFTLTPQKITLQKLTGKIGKSNISVTGDVYNYLSFVTKKKDMIKGDLILLCDTLDLNQWVTPVINSSTSTNSTQTLSNEKLEVIEVPKNIEFVFDSDIKYVKYDDMKISDLDGEIKIKDGMMTLKETGFNSLNAKFSVSGDYDTRDLSHPLFDMAVDIKELDIARAFKEIRLIHDMAPAAADCEGQFSVTYSVKGELDQNMNPKTETIIGGGRIRIANAKIDGMKIFEELSKAAKKNAMNDPHLKDFVMDTEIKDNKLFVKPFSIKISGFNTEVEGVNEISGAIQYLVKVELLPIEKLKIPFHVTGTYDNPKVAIGKGHKLPGE